MESTDDATNVLRLPHTSGSIMNPLSEANASWIGEGLEERAGYHLASAGDVNNDGYDDLLVAAHLDDDGGRSAGQCYLLLGGVDMNLGLEINLSQANAS